ncbi:MAG TPA: DUF881 domain-containing protein [Dermatophilaceae bacterium]|nr:DUF881 domain-containing protein [Dermatophilaceae bacterium]
MVDDAAAAPSTDRPADVDRADEGLADEVLADEGLPNQQPDQGSADEPPDDAVATEALPVEQVHEPFPPQPVEDAYSTRPLPAPHPYDQPFSAHRVDDPAPSDAMAADHIREPQPAEPEREPFASHPVEDSGPTETMPVDHVHEPAPVELEDEGIPTRPHEEPRADEHESAQQPAPAAVPPPDVIDDRAALTSEAATDYTPEEPVGGPVGKPVEGVAAWRRLLRMGLPRATKANVLGGLLAVLLGLAIATQVQLTQERGLSQLSQTDLIRVLDDVSLRSSRLDAQIRELEATRDRLRSGTGSSAEALAQAQKRVDTLGILAGTVAATGPGVVITLDDPDEALTGPIILDLIQELRDAGAEAIEVGGVRVVASSFVAEVDGDIAIDDSRVTRPIAIKAIGDAKTLSSAMTIPGGIVETVRQKNATARIVEQEAIEITSLHTAQDLKNARVVE